MKAFQYATAHSTDSARELVGDNGAYLAGGNDLLGLLKEYLVSAGHSGEHQVAARPGQNRARRKILDDRRARHRRANRERRGNQKSFSRPARRRVRNRLAADPQRRHRRRQSRATFALLVFPPSRHRLPQERRRPLLRAQRRKPLSQPVHRQHLHQPGRFQSRDHFRRAGRHGHRAARRQGNAHEHGRTLPARVGKSARAQFAQPRRPDFARGNPDGAQPQRLSAGRATNTRSTGRWSVARRRRKSWTEN